MVVDDNSSGGAALAVGVAGACVVGTDGADRAIKLSSLVVVLPSTAKFASIGFRGLPDLVVVLAGTAIFAPSLVVLILVLTVGTRRTGSFCTVNEGTSRTIRFALGLLVLILILTAGTI